MPSIFFFFLAPAWSNTSLLAETFPVKPLAILERDSAAAAKSLQSCPTLCDPIDGSPPGSPIPGKNTGVGCHFLLQCMKVKSESEVAQSYLTLSDPMDCSLPGSSVHGIFQARVLEWGAIAFSVKGTLDNARKHIVCLWITASKVRCGEGHSSPYTGAVFLPGESNGRLWSMGLQRFRHD